MNKIVFFLILMTMSSVCWANNPTVKEIRLLYYQAADNKMAVKKLIDLLAPYNKKNNTLFLGYGAAATMMMARHTYNPFAKLSHFNKGKRMLEKAIEADHKNIELRFLRFTAQTNAPAFLGYNDHVLSDKAFLLRHVSELTDIDLQKLINKYLKDFS